MTFSSSMALRGIYFCSALADSFSFGVFVFFKNSQREKTKTTLNYWQDTSKSILGTAQTLWHDGNPLVAFLIVFFSIFVPALKLALLASSYLFKRFGKQLALSSGFLSKWSMADVFVMALIIAFLAIKASSGNSALLQTSIELETGFYYFLGYCLLSIASSQLLVKNTTLTIKD